MLRRLALWVQTPRSRRTFTVLALESSADDTCAAVVSSNRQILSNIVIKQTKELEDNGGIHPRVAIEAHQRNLPRAVRRALDEARVNVQGDIDGIAYTRGPGIGGCLSVCSNAAKTLAAALGKPLVGVHHMQAHALTPLLTSPADAVPSFPYLTLLISGGHTILVLVKSPRQFELLTPAPILSRPQGPAEGSPEMTIAMKDLSIGNAYDKVAKLLGLASHPGGLGHGAALEQFCLDNPMEDRVWDGIIRGLEEKVMSKEEGVKQRRLTLAVPSPGHLMFSYAGLFSEFKQFVERHTSISPLTLSTPLPDNLRIALAHAFQSSAVEQLEEKLDIALRRCDANIWGEDRIKDVVISGGVASNMYLRKRVNAYLQQYSRDHRIGQTPVVASYPPAHLCTDNAAMIGWASLYRFMENDTDTYDINLRSRWPIDEL